MGIFIQKQEKVRQVTWQVDEWSRMRDSFSLQSTGEGEGHSRFIRPVLKVRVERLRPPIDGSFRLRNHIVDT